MNFKVIRLNSIDWLIITVDDCASQEQLERIRDHFENAGIQHVVVIHTNSDQGVTFDDV